MYLNWFWDYPQQGTQYRFGLSVVTSLLVVESTSRSKSGNLGFVMQHQIRCTLQVGVCVLNHSPDDEIITFQVASLRYSKSNRKL